MNATAKSKPLPEFKKHRFNVFPEMQPEEFDRLRTDIFMNGYDPKQPVWIYEGKIIDGWNRYRACKALGITPVFKDFQGSTLEAVQFIVRTNNRRDLNSSQRAAIAVEAEDLIEVLKKEAAERMLAGVVDGAGGRGNKKENPVQLIAQGFNDPQQNKVRTKLAETFGTNRQYVSDATKIKAEAPEAFDDIKSGKKTITEYKREKKIEERKKQIATQKKQIEEEAITAPEGKFNVIVLDPPWNYGREYDPDGSRVANPYPEMSQAELLNMEIPADNDCVMWLWTTHQFLWDAKALLDHWGFTYKACLTWNKEKIGMGHWLRMQCEFCLLAIKGQPIWDNTRYRDIISEPRREHSRKPEAFYKMVNEICYGRKLEYFAREERDGWVVFGNDTKKF